MSTEFSTRGTAVPPERLAEAGVWISRLHSGEPDKAAVAGVKRWLKADPMNARALELCTEMWEQSAALPRVMAFDAPEPAVDRRRRGFAWAGAGALAALAVFVAVAWWPRGDVATDIGEQRLVTLEDGTHVFLNTETRVHVHYDAKRRFVELKSGEAMFDVAKRPTWPFVVKAGNREIRALGTSFVVRREGADTAVTLVEGKVTVTTDAPGGNDGPPRISTPLPSAADGAFVLTPGQRLTFHSGRASLENTSLDSAIAWRRGQIVLDDTPLGDAVSELNRYSKVKLEIERPEARAIKVTGLFQTGDSLSFAHAVAQTYGLSVEEHGDAILLRGAPSAAVAGAAPVVP